MTLKRISWTRKWRHTISFLLCCYYYIYIIYLYFEDLMNEENEKES